MEYSPATVCSLGSRFICNINRRKWMRLLIVLGTLLIFALTFCGLRLAQAQSICADFDPQDLLERLHKSSKEENTFNNTEVEEISCSIIHHNMTLTAQLDCSSIIDPRYDHLRPTSTLQPKVQYFFALDLYQAFHVIIPLLGSVIEAIRFLGPENCALSIVEGRSTDGTYAVLAGLKQELAALGVRYFLSRSFVSPKANGENRITALATLRNLALEPLFQVNDRTTWLNKQPKIVFINDVVLCPEDILELLHQHSSQTATMTCAFDWNGGGDLFYDSWVSRSMSGNLFFEVTHDAAHWLGDDMFFDHPASKTRWDQSLPIQVYSCWGGMVTLEAEPFLHKGISFRSSDTDECYMGEPMALAKDFWRAGLGKILAVPSVNVGYEYDGAQDAKGKRGYVHQIVGHIQYNSQDELVIWQESPPSMVKCMPVFSRQWWVPPT
ncbi:unnamed protein product [Penicillium pancosmium]